MRAKHLILVLAAALPTSGANAQTPTGTLASAALRGADGSDKGTASVVVVDGRVQLQVAARGLTAGEHGMHLHTVGRCDGPDFVSAGSHLNPQGKQHGNANPQGAHLGDLPNLNVGDNGMATLIANIPGTPATVSAGLFDADGTAVVVHAGPDDYKTDPSGNSGGRVLCGVLTKAHAAAHQDHH